MAVNRVRCQRDDQSLTADEIALKYVARTALFGWVEKIGQKVVMRMIECYKNIMEI